MGVVNYCCRDWRSFFFGGSLIIQELNCFSSVDQDEGRRWNLIDVSLWPCRQFKVLTLAFLRKILCAPTSALKPSIIAHRRDMQLVNQRSRVSNMTPSLLDKHETDRIKLCRNSIVRSMIKLNRAFLLFFFHLLNFLFLSAWTN